MSTYQIEDVRLSYDRAEVLRGVSAVFDRPGLVAIAGPNGAGKSTLLSVMAGLNRHFEGGCRYDGKDVREWPRRAFARQVAVVEQSLRLEFPFTAEQVVYMGRTPFCDGLFEAPEDARAVAAAMELTDTVAFRDRDFRSLSGGERQRVVLASALAQQPRVLLLDEPTTFLDLSHQIAIYRLLAELPKQNILAVTVTHDLNLAATFAERLLLLHHGEVAADGPPKEVLTGPRIEEVFGIQIEVAETAAGRPWIHYEG